jgi:hypothetical protein
MALTERSFYLHPMSSCQTHSLSRCRPVNSAMPMPETKRLSVRPIKMNKQLPLITILFFAGIDVYTHQQRLVADKLSYPFSIAVTDSHYYWSDWNTKKIESIDRDGVRESIQVSLFTSKMYGMTSITDRCPYDFNICSSNNGDCPADHVCLVNRLMPSGKTCKCVTSGACNIHDE